jgi:lipopolysaccharide transport system ATP-binding protein
MTKPIIKVENLSKKYRLGTIGSKTLRADLNRWWAKVRGKDDPLTKVDQTLPALGQKTEFWALRDISFEVQEGEAVGIIGMNGAGKSTLLKILSRVTSPTTGQILANGRIASLLEVGTGFHPELTGRENIFLNGAILGMTKREIRSKLDEIVSFSGVELYIDTPVKRYSSGMHVRLAFAVAAHLEPEILIVDEVLAVGDAEFQKKCLGKMNEVTGEGRTILFVSHNMAAVKKLCKRGILLKSGKIEVNGSAEEAIENYLFLNSSDFRPEATWENVEQAPGGKVVRIIAVRILNEKEQVTDALPIDQEIFVEIDFLNKVEGIALSSSIQLLDRSGVCVLYTANWSSAILNVDPYSNARFKKGVYRSMVRIPANFLNEGVYMINAFVLQDVSTIIAFAEEAVSFSVLDTGEMRKEYTGEWSGLVRPRLAWQTGPVYVPRPVEGV